MKIRIFKRLLDDKYSANIYTEDWSELDIQLMVKYGEPEINLGGTFTEGELTYTLSDNYSRIRSNSPFVMSFDYRDYDDAKDRIDLWASTIQTRITEAVEDLRLNTDDYTSETVVNV